MCSRSSCSTCTMADGCGWCARGTCMSVADAASKCSDLFISESDQCPSVGADVMLKQITGMLGAIVGVAVILNLCNRMSNRRKKRKLKRSIFTLPVYVYTASSPSSSRQRANDARRQARAQGSLDPAQDDGSPRLSSPSVPCSGSCTSSEDGDSVSEATCSVCLAAYEEEEVIKVLPCGHEFHSGCLDSWLELKAMCPLCKAPAFSKSRSRDRGRGRDWVARGQAQIQGLISVASSRPLLRFRSPNEMQTPQLDNSGREGGGALAGLSSESAAPPEPSASIAEIRSQPPQLGSSGGTGGVVDAGLFLESVTPPETSLGVAETTEVNDSQHASEEQPGGATVTGRTEDEGSPLTEEMALKAGAGVLEDVRARQGAETASSGEKSRALTGEPTSAPAEPEIVSKSDHVTAAVSTTGVGGTVARGGGKGWAGLTHPPVPSPPCHDDREASLSELEGGQAGPAKAKIVAGVTAEGGHDVVAAGGTAGSLDIENGGSFVDGSMNGMPSASPARLVTVAPSHDG